MFDDLLVVGWDQATGVRVHVDDMPLGYWRAKGFSGDRTLVCMFCLQEGNTVPLVVKGKVLGARRHHFAHPAGTAHAAVHGPETAWHANGKWAIAEMVNRHPGVEAVLVEWPTHDRKRRADVRVLMRDGSKLAFELQYRPLSDPDYVARCDDYRRDNTKCIWLWRPGIGRPGIMLQEGQPIWWLHVDAGKITGLFGQPHHRTEGWHDSKDLANYAMHWPPCPGDQLIQHTWPLADTVLDSSGMRPAAAVNDLIVRQHQELQDLAAGIEKARQDRARRQQEQASAAATVAAPPDSELVLGQHNSDGVPGAAREPDDVSPYAVDDSCRSMLLSPHLPLKRQPAWKPTPRVPQPGDELLPRSPKSGRRWICPRCGARTRMNTCRDCDWPAKIPATG